MLSTTQRYVRRQQALHDIIQMINFFDTCLSSELTEDDIAVKQQLFDAVETIVENIDNSYHELLMKNSLNRMFENGYGLSPQVLFN
jgi:hypothetical protein